MASSPSETKSMLDSSFEKMGSKATFEFGRNTKKDELLYSVLKHPNFFKNLTITEMKNFFKVVTGASPLVLVMEASPDKSHVKRWAEQPFCIRRSDTEAGEPSGKFVLSVFYYQYNFKKDKKVRINDVSNLNIRWGFINTLFTISHEGQIIFFDQELRERGEIDSLQKLIELEMSDDRLIAIELNKIDPTNSDGNKHNDWHLVWFGDLMFPLLKHAIQLQEENELLSFNSDSDFEDEDEEFSDADSATHRIEKKINSDQKPPTSISDSRMWQAVDMDVDISSKSSDVTKSSRKFKNF